jgi:putative transposase
VIVHQAYRFALNPTPRQQDALASHVGGARFAYNWGLGLVQRRLDERAAGQDVEVPWTLPALRREWNRAKAGVAPWWAENSKEAYGSGLYALARGLRNWVDSKQGRRAGARVGFPRPKRKGRGRQACRFTTGAIRVEPDRTATVGVDVGVAQLAVLSSGERIANPRPLTAALGRLGRTSRQLARRQGSRAPDGT